MNVANSPRTSWLTTERLAVAGLLAFTLLVRGGVLWGMREKLTDDPDAYREIAENLLQYGVFGVRNTPTAYRPPLYPIVLSNLPAADGVHVSLAKVVALHLLLGMATVLLTYLTARRLFRGAGVSPAITTPLPPLLAALLVACDPILLNQSALVMTETLATFLAILALWLLARFDASRNWWNAGLVGGAIGLAALCRPTFLPWLGLVGVGMVLARGRNCGVRNAERGVKEGKAEQIWVDWGFRLANLAALVIVAAGVMSPWAIRNQQVFGRLILTTTHGGYTLFLGNNWSFYEWLRQPGDGLPWKTSYLFILDDLKHKSISIRTPTNSSPLILEISTEDEVDKNRYDSAYQAMLAQPQMALTAAFYRVRQLWTPLSYKLTADESTSRMLLRYATAGWYCGVYLLVAVGVWRLRWQIVRPPWVWGLLLCLTFTAVHTLYWCNLRMRAPLMPFVTLVAGAALMKQERHLPTPS